MLPRYLLYDVIYDGLECTDATESETIYTFVILCIIVSGISCFDNTRDAVVVLRIARRVRLQLPHIRRPVTVVANNGTLHPSLEMRLNGSHWRQSQPVHT